MTALSQTAYVAGLTALRDADYATAIPLLNQAVRDMPTHAGRWRNLVRALLVAGHYEPTVHAARSALRLTPDDPELLFALGSALSGLGQPASASTIFRETLRLRPDHAPTWLGLANVTIDLDDLAMGEALTRRAIALDPTLPEAYASLGYVLTRLGRLREAILACDDAIRHSPDFAHAHWNRAIALLLAGNFSAGFAAFEWRKAHPRFQRDFPRLPQPAWQGANPDGRHVLIRTEQGAGDAIQFARYALLIRDRGGIPTLACYAPLVPLFDRLAGVRIVDRETADVAAYDSWIDQASLPLVFGTTPDTVPLAGGYLTADPHSVRTWRKRLPPGPRVGLAFAGNPLHSGDRRRSIPPELFLPLLSVPCATFINLQHGETADRIGLPSMVGLLPHYGETAALIEALDLVISVDTSVAHLAGALGKPTWLLVPHAPDWRWMLDRHDTPWYRSMRLYRQPSAGDWVSVLRQVQHDLEKLTWRT
jgi:tetratricopeptide (TPR) repeat protein